jgi:uncharacterized protein YoxC
VSDIRFEEMLINNLKEELKELKQQLAEVQNSCDYYMNRANDLLIKNQDKISFAVEQLEQLKHDIWTDQQDDGWLDEQVDIYFLTETIDNQIKKLTHQHEDKGE